MDSLLGKTLKNRYRIDEHIGRGGMAEVYRAYDLQRGVYLALKILRDDLAEDIVFIRRFEREAKTLAVLQHPNIVRFYGFERSDGYVYMLMEYIEGKTLRKIISERSTPMTEGEVLEIIDPVCRALNYAHQMGRVHCDVKSANILIQKDGHVYLSDFGIARGMDMATSTMVGIGTPAYMAPELIKGEDPSPQADIYALGIMIYEMLTGGERPFTGERAAITGTTAEKIRWEHLMLAPIPPSQFNKNISSQMEYAILRCLSKNKAKRFSSTISLLKTVKQDNPDQYEELNKEIKYEFQKKASKTTQIDQQPWKFPAIVGAILIFVLGLVFLPRFLNNHSNSSAQNKSVVIITATMEKIPTSVPTEIPTEIHVNTPTPLPTAIKAVTYSIRNPYYQLTVRTGPMTSYPTYYYMDESTAFIVNGKDKTERWLSIKDGSKNGWVERSDLLDNSLKKIDKYYISKLPIVEASSAVPTSRPPLDPYQR